MAVWERRVLEFIHTRNYDDSRAVAMLVQPADRLHPKSMLAYPRPCVLSAHVLNWLDYNGWDTVGEAMEFLLG